VNVQAAGFVPTCTFTLKIRVRRIMFVPRPDRTASVRPVNRRTETARLALLFAIALSAVATAYAQEPPALESFQLVILQRPAHPTEYPDAKLEEIQNAHIAHLRQLAEAGKLLVAGPLADQPDPRLRGLELFRVGSLDEARKLAEEDPAVKAGRLEAVVMTWMTQKGALAFPVAEKLAKKQ
jgi:uncharacterized protein YciI